MVPCLPRAPRAVWPHPAVGMVFSLAWLVLGNAAAAPPPPVDALPVLDFFFEPGCAECETVRREILPELALRYQGGYELRLRDLGVASNYLLLVQYQEQTGIRENAPVQMGLDGRFLLAGLADIRTNLYPTLDLCLAARSAAPRMEPPATGAMELEPVSALRRRAREFTVLGVAAAGLVDSLNPCAIGTLVFFMSLLALARVGRPRLLLAGGAFIAGCFATYFLLGFGVLRLLHTFRGFHALRRTVDVLMVGLLAWFAALSFRDAARYRRTANAGELTLRLPRRIEQWIHEMIRRGLRRRQLAAAGLGLGIVVTALESVCTGQVYVPTLVWMVKTDRSVWRGLGLLAVYNAMFVLPLLIVLALVYQGLRTPALVAWSRRHVMLGKILLGVFFVVLAVLILVA